MSRSSSRTNTAGGTLKRTRVRSPRPDIGAVLLRALAERWQRFSFLVEQSRKRPTEKAIHDLRVATRRLISTLDIVRLILRGNEFAGVRKGLKRHLRALSALRDNQVQIIAVRNLVRRFPVARGLLASLLIQEKLLLKRARREIAAIQIQSLEKKVASVENQLEMLLADHIVRDVSRQVMLGALGTLFSRALLLKAVAMSGRIARIHRFRITFKRFRYTVESLRPLLPGVRRRTFNAMNQYQTTMGDIQDTEVLIISVNAYTRRHSQTAPLQCLRLKQHLMNKRKELIVKFVASAHTLNRFWPALFAKSL